MTYEKIDGTIYKVVTTKTEIDLESLKAEVENLKAMTEPSDEELIELGRTYHPFYDVSMTESLEEKITEIEKEVEPVVLKEK